MTKNVALLISFFALQAGASFPSEDISTLSQYVGQYFVDPNTDPYAMGCAGYYHQLNIALDAEKNAVVSIFSGNDVGNNPTPNNVPQYTYLSLTEFTSVPHFPTQERERTVIEGQNIITQTSTYFIFWGPWQDSDVLIKFGNGNSVTIPPYNCKFVKSGSL